MASPNVVTFTDTSFQSEVIDADLPVFVDFWAIWCGPCRQIAPSVDRLADEYEGRLKVGKLDIDSNQIVAQQYGVRSIPTMMIFKGGRMVDQIIGAQPYSKIEAQVRRHV